MVDSYKPRGKYFLPGLVIALIFLIFITLSLALLYSVILSYHIGNYGGFFVLLGSVVVFTFKLTALAAILVLLSKACALAIRLGHIRANNAPVTLALTYSSLFLYAHWTAYITLRNFESFSLEHWLWVSLHPQEIIDGLSMVYQWSKENVLTAFSSDLFLLGIWLGEAVAIVLLPVWLCSKHKVPPYSELASRWYRGYQLHTLFERIALKSSFIKEVESDIELALNGLGKGHLGNYARVTIHYEETERAAYLTIENIIRGSSGKTTKDCFLLLFPISSELAKSLMAEHHAKRVYLSFM